MKKPILVLTILSAVAILGGCGSSNSSNPAPTMQSSANQASTGTRSAGAKAADETAALDTIAKINDAESNYFKRNRRYAITFDELVDAHLLNNAPGPADTGYDFNLRPAADAQTYKLAVNPAAPTPTVRHFFTDESGAVHAEAGRDATPDSPKI